MNKLSNSIKQFIKYREYFMYQVKVTLKSTVQGSYLGYIWWILDPFMFMFVYVFVVGFIFGQSGPQYPVFVFCGLLSWKWTATSVQSSATSIKSKANVIKQVYLPKFLLPLINIVSNGIHFLFSLIALVPLLIVYKIPLTLHVFEFIIVFAVQFLVLTAISLIVAHFGVFLKDLVNILMFTIRFWFYMSPILYDPADYPEKVRTLFYFNPMTGIIESYRNVIMYGSSPNYQALGLYTIMSIIFIFIGLSLFNKHDNNYARLI